ncbi:glycoside hydrolase [Photobacterium sp. CCB-ST2H9]|uniref:glycoside hydrolase n=1 Tax=Photobacterium sp. CCB-ST2H9 TaxID=2912855 RepID=UPI002004A2BC|nr:glycoside hydrolase [Photobacterium sp. CCB-ST2H9]UTM60331.1 glycoside hydrolase [Photobacterium sp. CCB-ST2H9]
MKTALFHQTHVARFSFSAAYKPLLLLVCAAFAAPETHAEMLSLRHQNQQVRLDPQTLAIDWIADGQTYAVNQANASVDGLRQSVRQLPQTQPNVLSWLWLPSNIQVSARLEANDLSLQFERNADQRISRNQPVRLNWFDLPEEFADALLLPLNEGLRVPVRHETWASYLQNEYSGSNTTQDLKMPFWTVSAHPVSTAKKTASHENKAASADRFFSYLLLNPFNNRIDFRDLSGQKTKGQQAAVEMTSSHLFTALNRKEPFQLLIHMGTDNLSGASRYRQWREAQGERDSLSDKAAHNPNVRKLIGASHVYLFGSDGIAEQDVTDWAGLMQWFFSDPNLSPFADQEAVRELTPLTQSNGKIRLNQYQKRLLVEAVNRSLAAYFPFSAPQVDEDGIARQYEAVRQRKAYLKDHAARFLIAPSLWGQSLSQPVLQTFQAAGLNRLWIGLDNWLPAFFQPEVVDQAKQSGYLVATYDSYNTAIHVTDNESWLTAHLPESVRKACAIENADGSKQRGFRGQGNYLNPGCGTDYVKRRAQHIMKFGRFNSLFLDVDATGMAREDYTVRPYLSGSEPESGMSEQRMTEAFNARMSWMSEQGMVLGSEDGNSITTRGVVFAHGMETTGFGWTDPDMKRNRRSPYFLGAWYPDQKPAFFFRSAQVKEPYRSLFFTPAFKIPLYQAVFHDELMNTHHWHMDSLKFSDVKGVRDLAGMLYNTPPMVHLSRDEAQSTDLPRIRALQHYQQGFAPVHQVLWDKALVGFDWLDKDGNIQQTRFSDGSQIVANFTKKSQVVRIGDDTVTLPAMSFRAELQSGDGQKPSIVMWTSGVY